MRVNKKRYRFFLRQNTRKRCKYMCMITEKDGKPWFTTRYQSVASRSKSAEKTTQGEWMEMSNDCVKSRPFATLLARLKTPKRISTQNITLRFSSDLGKE